MKVTAAVARDSGGDFALETLELDSPRADEILVRVVGVGLCHTDLVFKSSGTIPFPAVFGHEGSGIVEAVGIDVKKVSPGDRVVITFRSCGKCDRCEGGSPAYCRTMPALNYTGMRDDGTRNLRSSNEAVSSNFFGQSSFATHCLTYERNVVKVPKDVPLELMGPLGCGIQTGVGGVMRSLACEAGTSILILGGGAVGLSAVMGAVIQKCKTIIVSEPHAARRALATELGATHTIDPSIAPGLVEQIKAIVPNGVDYAFDTTGIPSVLQATMNCLGSHGVFGIVGVCPPNTPVPGDLLNVITFGHTVKGIIEGDSDPDVFVPQMIELFRLGQLPFDKLVRTYPLEDINRAVADQSNGQSIKVVLLTGQPA